MILPDATYLMLQALLTNQTDPLIATITQVAIGRNKGGAYLSLFAKQGQYRFIGVYEESWFTLPPAIVAQGKELLGKTVAEETVYNRDQCQRFGVLFDANPTFEVVRTRYEKENKKSEWYFIGVTSIDGVTESQDNPPSDNATIAPPANSPFGVPLFESRADALEWAVSVNAYNRVDSATIAYLDLYALIKAQSAELMFSAWRRHIGVKLWQEKKVVISDKISALEWAATYCEDGLDEANRQWRILFKRTPDQRVNAVDIRQFVESYDPFTHANDYLPG